MTNPQEFNPRTIAAQHALVRLLNTPPETIVSMLDRLEIPWERKQVDGVVSLVIAWPDLVVGEQRLQKEGPFVRKLVEEMKGQAGQLFSGEQIPGANHPLLGGN